MFKLVDRENLKVTLIDAEEVEVEYSNVCDRVGWTMDTLYGDYDRRALLDHLLTSEGLPGIEEIRRLEDVAATSIHPCDMSHHVAKWTPEIRQATLSELLEAEARERVEVDEIDEREDEQDDVAWRCLKYSIRVDRYDVQVDLDLQGSMDDFDDTPNRVITPEMRMETVEEVEALILCLAAALAEKRKREEVAS